MLNRLQKLFPSLVTDEEINPESYENYYWFMIDKNKIIGIAKHDLTTKDTSLLSTFLTPYNMVFPHPTKREKEWIDLITAKGKDKELPQNLKYRFVYFSIQKYRIEPTSFKEAIEAIFQQEVPILWDNEHQGVIVEETLHTTKEENLSYAQIIDTLMSDLYVKIAFFVGPVLTDYKDVSTQYNTVTNGAEIAFAHSQKSVLTYIDVIPYLFIEEMDTPKRQNISHTVLKEVVNETDVIQTMETFMRCNLNISETAKELYMHRNTLQYRLDKFHEKTGIDVRQFHQAMTLFLILKANK